MSDRPILFSAPMVRALLAGRKTQTRRVIKTAPAEATSAGTIYSTETGHSNIWTWLSGDPRDVDTWGALEDFRLPYKIGSRLWVRETWARAYELDDDDQPASAEMTYYRADGEPFSSYLDPNIDQWRDSIPWRPSIFMPRHLSRLTLTITDVRVQRVQDISREDAVAEGVTEFDPTVTSDDEGGPIARYALLWDSINDFGSWDANPWVAAYTFTVERRNIDQPTVTK